MSEDQRRIEQRIRRHYELSEKGFIEADHRKKRAFQCAMLTGKYLNKMKLLIEHGDWMSWLETMPFKQKTANNYMWLYDNRHDDELVSLTNLDAVYKIRAKQANKKKQEREEEETKLVDILPANSVVPLDLEFTERQYKEIQSILKRMSEKVLYVDSQEIALLRCLRYANKTMEKNHVNEYKLSTVTESLAKGLGQGTIQEEIIRGDLSKRSLQARRQRKRAVDNRQTERGEAA